MAKEEVLVHSCMVCGSGFQERDLTKVPLPQPSWDARICKACRARVVALEEPQGGEKLKNRLNVFICGDSDEDLEVAIVAMKRLVDKGHVCGVGGTDTCAFRFDIQVRG